jgi:GNAT superfamily N-acetyltransferase
MEPADLPGVVSVARASFPDHFEDPACFVERFALYPRGCFVLENGAVPVAGYLIAYPWSSGSAPPLNSLIHALPDNAELVYLHDLALHPAARSRGFTGEIVEMLAAQVREDGWTEIALVAVNDATAFWERQGFVVVHDPGMAEKLASYGADARYMKRRI